MKNKKLIAVVSVMAVMVIGLASVAYAVDFKTPAEIVAGLTGKSVEEVTASRQKGESYGEQAEEAGELKAFQDAAQTQFEARVNALVEEGQLTKEDAAERIQAMKDRMATCDGEGTAMGNGGIGGRGLRDGSGAGQGGSGNGLQDGTGAGQSMRGGRGGMARGNGGVCIVDNAA